MFPPPGRVSNRAGSPGDGCSTFEAFANGARPSNPDRRTVLTQDDIRSRSSSSRSRTGAFSNKAVIPPARRRVSIVTVCLRRASCPAAAAARKRGKRYCREGNISTASRPKRMLALSSKLGLTMLRQLSRTRLSRTDLCMRGGVPSSFSIVVPFRRAKRDRLSVLEVSPVRWVSRADER